MTMPRLCRALCAGSVVLLLAGAGGCGNARLREMPSMAGEHMLAGDDRTAAASGLALAPSVMTVGAGVRVSYVFRIRRADGSVVTGFAVDQTKPMHLYVIRADLTGFQHVHPVMSADGAWTASLAALRPGTYRVYASFVTSGSAGRPAPLVLSHPLTVPGAATNSPLPAPARSTTADGYTITVATTRGGGPMASMAHHLTITISRYGRPVTDLQPYLDSYAHLTAFHWGDLGFAHLHPQDAPAGGHGGATLTFEAMFPRPGDWRLFLQFQTAGVLHTAAITLDVGN
jgi:hypothetical protein